MSDHIHGNHDACDPRYCSDVEIAAQRAEIKRMCEERDSAQRCIEKLTAEIAALRARVAAIEPVVLAAREYREYLVSEGMQYTGMTVHDIKWDALDAALDGVEVPRG